MRDLKVCLYSDGSSQRVGAVVDDRVYDAVAHMNSVLSNEKPKIHQTLTEKMKRLVDILPDLNLNDDENLVFEQEPIRQLVAEQQLMMYEHDGFWQPMDTIRERDILNDYWNTGSAPWKTW